MSDIFPDLLFSVSIFAVVKNNRLLLNSLFAYLVLCECQSTGIGFVHLVTH